MKKIALVMPVFNHLDNTRKSIQILTGLFNQGHFQQSEFLLVVVDDGSTDGTTEWLRAHHPEVHVLQGDGSLWWSGGVNRGVEYAIQKMGAHFILLWNNDITPADDYFIQLDRLIPEAEGGTIVGSKIYYQGNDRMIWSCGGFFDPKTGKKYMAGMDQPDSERFEKPVRADWLPGMGSLIPSSVIDTIGYWDEKVFPQYHGDSDYTFRASRAGFRIVVFPQLKLWNDKASSGLTPGGTLRGLVQSLTSIRSNLNVRKNFTFYRRHAESWKAYRYLVRYYFRVIGGFIKWRILTILGRNKVKKY